MKQQTFDLPNPEAWCDATQAEAVLGISRTRLYSLIAGGVLRDYKIGTARVFWRAELLELKSARDRVKGRGIV